MTGLFGHARFSREEAQAALDLKPKWGVNE